MRVLLRILLALVIAILLVVPVVIAVAVANDSSVKYKPIPAAQLGVVWSDRVFLNRTIAANWLGARGTHYGLWARRHPPAAKKIAKRPTG